jgi:hypothetical protein
MKRTTIRAVEMVRRIHAAHYEQLRDRSAEEHIVFYRTKARLLEIQLAAPRATGRRTSTCIAVVSLLRGGHGPNSVVHLTPWAARLTTMTRRDGRR